ncbi:thiamine pyrophosphate-binding protein [uncultured Prevotella sp.]|uniref:thiamine pyrophosphate-binding protein n=1 Tax=uncultured Prevotella sp. TaxID=159272 RepID=UPI00260A307C|nr:thiamine pyrophosphate-binding protein [uncultured Prevotella sp.]
MENHYTNARNVQIVIALMKAHGVKKVIASPGATDLAIVASLQQDPYFEMYSSIDERSAAYMACGMAAESGEPVAITCTGATSSRNYMPGLTEAYYRQLPILAITCSRSNANIGHYVDQVTDRTQLPSDVVMESVQAQSIHCPEDEWDVMVKVNKAMIGLTRNGGGPTHINLVTASSSNFAVKEIAPVRKISLYLKEDKFPEVPQGKVGIFVGAHEKWPDELTAAVDNFCEVYNAMVICDPTSNYKGKYRILMPLLCEQAKEEIGGEQLDLMIQIGFVSSMLFKKAKVMWRVAKDGVVRDTFRKTNSIFQMPELDFFTKMVEGKSKKENTVYSEYKERYDSLLHSIPNLPFSNIWVAQQLSGQLPENSVLHLGIRNSLRSWGYFDIPNSVLSYCNTGGFGIDGGISSLIGASMVNQQSLFFGVFGDLLFFYDMNSLGNRDIKPNLRIIVINNGLGQEFKNVSFPGSLVFGDDIDKFTAAKGHFACQSKTLVKDYAENLGFEYLTASNKEEFAEVYKRFISKELTERPMLFEIFTDTKDETQANYSITSIELKSKFVRKVHDTLMKPELVAVKNLAKKIVK